MSQEIMYRNAPPVLVPSDLNVYNRVSSVVKPTDLGDLVQKAHLNMGSPALTVINGFQDFGFDEVVDAGISDPRLDSVEDFGLGVVVGYEGNQLVILRMQEWRAPTGEPIDQHQVQYGDMAAIGITRRDYIRIDLPLLEALDAIEDLPHAKGIVPHPFGHNGLGNYLIETGLDMHPAVDFVETKNGRMYFPHPHNWGANKKAQTTYRLRWKDTPIAPIASSNGCHQREGAGMFTIQVPLWTPTALQGAESFGKYLNDVQEYLAQGRRSWKTSHDWQGLIGGTMQAIDTAALLFRNEVLAKRGLMSALPVETMSYDRRRTSLLD